MHSPFHQEFIDGIFDPLQMNFIKSGGAHISPIVFILSKTVGNLPFTLSSDRVDTSI